MSEADVLKKWATHYDSKDAHERNRTKLADWLIKGIPMDEEWHREFVVMPALEKMELRPEHEVLEIGCGSGLFLTEIDKVVKRCVGADFSETIMKSFEIKGEKVKCAAHDLPFDDNSFDRILMYGVVVCFPSFDYFKRVVDRCIKMLRKNGIFLIGDVPFDEKASWPPNIHFDKHAMIDYLDSLKYPYSVVVPHSEKRKVNSRLDIVIYKE